MFEVKKMTEENDVLISGATTWVMLFVGFLIVCSIFEIGLLIYAWVNADKVECNLLWCTFTDYGDEMVVQNSYSNMTTSITSTSTSSILVRQKLKNMQKPSLP